MCSTSAMTFVPRQAEMNWMPTGLAVLVAAPGLDEVVDHGRLCGVSGCRSMIAQQQPIWPAPALLAPEPRALDATIRPPIAPLADADARPQHRHPFDATSTISCRSSVTASESTHSAVQRNKPAIPTPTKTSGHTLSN